MECNIATNDIYVGAMLSTMYASAVSHVTGEEKDRTLKIPLVQGQPIVLGQNICNIRKECYLF